MFKILIIEDSIAIKKELQIYLTQFYQVKCVDDFTKTFQLIDEFQPHLLLVDLNLPIVDGHRICEEVRKKSDIPIIVVTSKDSSSDELLAMKLGADDYVQKPYHLQILHSRIENLLRRCYHVASTLKLGDLKLDFSKNQLHYQEETILLTNTETKILYYLFSNKNQLISKTKLMQFLWDSELFIDENALAVNISRIRKKIPFDFIQTKRGIGYMVYEE